MSCVCCVYCVVMHVAGVHVFASFFTGNFIELFSQKVQRNELILREELKLLLHLCQSADDMVIAKDAIYRYSACLY